MMSLTHKSRSAFDQELIALRDNVLRLSLMVDVAIQQSVKALQHQHIELARQIVADDQKINSLRYKIEDEAYVLMARQQPIARDLRWTVSAIHIAIELERMGDHAAAIATLAAELAKAPLLKPLVNIPRMAEIARDMLRQSLDAYVQWDADAARKILEKDAEVNALDWAVYNELLSFMIKNQDPATVNRATSLLWVSHNVERIADHATNICERVIYMVTGEVHQDSDLSRVRDISNVDGSIDD